MARVDPRASEIVNRKLNVKVSLLDQTSVSNAAKKPAPSSNTAERAGMGHGGRFFS
ncbi:MAG TPA: hypothetical protein VKZ59_11010 [Acidobacteriota bacterium]|nr:hypothetical protein [Acidobacteriota bacterium]